MQTKRAESDETWIREYVQACTERLNKFVQECHSDPVLLVRLQAAACIPALFEVRP
jgi:hypothetical protein